MLIVAGKACGNQRLVEMNQQVEANLARMITKIDDLGRQDGDGHQRPEGRPVRPDNTRFLHAAQQARHAALLDKARTALRQTELDRLRQQTAPLLDQLREQAATRPAALLHLAISCLDVLH